MREEVREGGGFTHSHVGRTVAGAYGGWDALDMMKAQLEAAFGESDIQQATKNKV